MGLHSIKIKNITRDLCMQRSLCYYVLMVKNIPKGQNTIFRILLACSILAGTVSFQANAAFIPGQGESAPVTSSPTPSSGSSQGSSTPSSTSISASPTVSTSQSPTKSSQVNDTISSSASGSTKPSYNWVPWVLIAGAILLLAAYAVFWIVKRK